MAAAITRICWFELSMNILTNHSEENEGSIRGERRGFRSIGEKTRPIFAEVTSLYTSHLKPARTGLKKLKQFGWKPGESFSFISSGPADLPQHLRFVNDLRGNWVTAAAKIKLQVKKRKRTKVHSGSKTAPIHQCNGSDKRGNHKVSEQVLYLLSWGMSESLVYSFKLSLLGNTLHPSPWRGPPSLCAVRIFPWTPWKPSQTFQKATLSKKNSQGRKISHWFISMNMSWLIGGEALAVRRPSQATSTHPTRQIPMSGHASYLKVGRFFFPSHVCGSKT